MIILTIRTDNPAAEIGLMKDGIELETYTWQAHRELSSTLHKNITKLLSKHRLNTQNLGGVVVYEGPGSFTGLRIGISTANAIAYGLNIPVLGCSGDTWAQDGARAITKRKKGQYILPQYGAPVHITEPKK